MLKMKKNTWYLLGASVAALGAAPALVAESSAQTRVDDGVIIVTAQKREQNLQEVPLAISAISAQKLEQLQVKDARDLTGLAPNVTVLQGTSSNSAAVISMRGITNPGSETFGLDTANGLYVDGIYIARSGAAGLDVTDVERVEVLRGPQGTLFGRNTTGGAISFISRPPADDMGIRGEVGYGNYNAFNGKVTVDTGRMLDVVKATMSYARRQRHGTYDNVLEPRDSRDPGSRRSDAFRFAVRVEPNDTGYFQYIFDWAKIRGNPNPFQLIAVADGTARPPLVINGSSVSQTQQAPVAQYLANATFLEPGCAALATPTREYRKRLCANSDADTVDKSWGHNFQMGNDFGPFGVKLTAGYRRWDNSYAIDDLDGMGTIRGPLYSSATLFNGMPASLLESVAAVPAAARAFIAASSVPTTTADLFETGNERHHQQFSTELEISGDTDTLDWVVGGFYFWEKGNEINPQTSGFVLDTNTLFLNRALGLTSSVANALIAANPARYRLAVTPAVLIYTTSAESKAAYGQFTLYPGGRDSGLSLTAGGRYTWDDKSILRLQNGAAPLARAEEGKASFSRFTWNLMGRYEFNPDVSVYARAATGYRSGGYNAGDPVVAGTNIVPAFQEESLISYEVGLKSQLFDRRVRLNIAAYHNAYDDLAVIQPVATTAGTFQTRIVNAGKVEYNGIEADFSASLNNMFSIDGSIGYVDVKYKEFRAGQPLNVNDPAVDIASVVRPSYTSPLTANIALNARTPIGTDGMELRGRIGYTHEDAKYSFNNSISSPFNEQIKGDKLDQIDAQIVLDRIPLGGGKARVMIWGKNLNNDHNIMRAIDFGALGYAGGYYNEPRTYGMTVGLDF